MLIFHTIGSFFLTALVFVLIFSALIILHELGHFWVARLAKVRVMEFGFGLPPKIWSHKSTIKNTVVQANGKKKSVKEEMEWTINAIPFGGFVRMLGENSEASCENDPRAFCNRPLLWRMAILVAGVTMNFLFAFALFVLIGVIGFDPFIDPNLQASPRFQEYFSDGHAETFVVQGFYEKKTDGAFVLAVQPDSPAAQAGLAAGDQIIRVENTIVNTPEEVKAAQQNTNTPALEYTLARFDGASQKTETLNVSVSPQEVNAQRSIGVVLLNEYYYQKSKVQLSLPDAVTEAWAGSKRLAGLSVAMIRNLIGSTLGKMFTLHAPQVPDELGGPVAIAGVTNELVKLGDISKILQFVGILSLSLAIINLVPFPALDGGRLFFQILEGVFFLLIWPIKKIYPKAKISHRIPTGWEAPFHVVGYVLLLILIVMVTVQDVGKMFS